MTPQVRIVVFSAILVSGARAVAAQAPDVPIPLPAVQRASPIDNGPLFGKPDLIVIARVAQICDTERVGDFVTASDDVVSPIVRHFVGVRPHPLRVNKRAVEDPDLRNLQFSFRAMADERTVSPPLSLGRRYVLLLNAVKFLSGLEYGLAPQVGFEIVPSPQGERVRPVVRGSELDAYDGRLLEDVIKEIRSGK